MNAYVERFVQAIEQECLNQFIIFDGGHVDHVCREYLEQYHTERCTRRWGMRRSSHRLHLCRTMLTSCAASGCVTCCGIIIGRRREDGRLR